MSVLLTGKHKEEKGKIGGEKAGKTCENHVLISQREGGRDETRAGALAGLLVGQRRGTWTEKKEKKRRRRGLARQRVWAGPIGEEKKMKEKRERERACLGKHISLVGLPLRPSPKKGKDGGLCFGPCIQEEWV